MNYKVKILEASNGDSFLINFNGKNLLIDGGIGRTYFKSLKEEIINIKNRGEVIDLIVITHIDDDHIGGIIKLFEDEDIDKDLIKEVWFNSEILWAQHINHIDLEPKEILLEDNTTNKMSVKQGCTLESKLLDLGCWRKQLIVFEKSFVELEFEGSKITILTPRIDSIQKLKRKWEREKPESKKMSTCKHDYDVCIDDLANKEFKEDSSITNKSSISFIFEFQNQKLLFLGDSHPSDVVLSLRELGFTNERNLKVVFAKLSHHGSKSNINYDLLALLDCNRFIVSTDGNKHCLPNKETFAKIIKSSQGEKSFIFNYPIFEQIFTKEELETYNIKCKHLNEFEV